MTTHFFDRIVCFTTGANLPGFNTTTHESRTKLKALTIAATIPTLCWALSLFLLVWKTMECSILVAIVAALIGGYLIFTVERLVIMSKKSIWLALARIILAILVAIIGSILLELPFFREEIHQQMPMVRHRHATQAQRQVMQTYAEQHRVNELESRAMQADAIFQQRQNEAVAEAAGMRGTGLKGAGSATQFKQRVTDTARAHSLRMQMQLQHLQQQMAHLQQLAYDSATAAFTGKGIIYQKQALDLVLEQNSAAKTLYWLITCLLFVLEFLVVVFKLAWPKTAWELENEMLDSLHQQRTRRMMGVEEKIMLASHHNQGSIARLSKRLASSANSLL